MLNHSPLPCPKMNKIEIHAHLPSFPNWLFDQILICYQYNIIYMYMNVQYSRVQHQTIVILRLFFNQADNMMIRNSTHSILYTFFFYKYHNHHAYSSICIYTHKNIHTCVHVHPLHVHVACIMVK